MSHQGRNVGGDHLPGQEGVEDEIRKKQDEDELPGDAAAAPGDAPESDEPPASEAEAEQ
jgi:hypothetical protein